MILLDEGADFTVCRMHIGGRYECLTMQDDEDPVKVKGETRIPAGVYEIKFRKHGGFHDRYLKKFGPEFHHGMLELQNVPNYDAILIHIGNTPKDTAGCILLGVTRHPTERNFIQGSEIAYKKFYPQVAAALLRGERVHLTIRYAKA